MTFLNRHLKHWPSTFGLAATALLAASQPTFADVPKSLGEIGTAKLLDDPKILEAPPSDSKRVYVTDPGFFHMTSLIYTIDGNNNELLGMSDAGKLPHVMLGDDGEFMAVANTVYSRVARGKRDDYIEVFDTETLEVIKDIDIPENRFLTGVMKRMATLSTDSDHLLFQQFSPSNEVGLVDLEAEEFVKMMPVPDCYHLFPAPDQNFFMHCRDGSMLQVTYDDDGNTEENRTEVFHKEDEYLINNPTYSDKTGRLVWPSYEGRIFQMDLSESGVDFAEPFEVFSAQEKADGWAPGGWQPIAYNRVRDEIYLLADQRSEWTHKMPSRYVFVIDAETGERLRRIDMGYEIDAIEVSQDSDPYLFAASVADTSLYTFDAISGDELGQVDELGRAPHILYVPGK